MSLHGFLVEAVDMDMNSLSPSMESIERAIQDTTKPPVVAIVVAHIFGARMSCMDDLITRAHSHHIQV